MSKREPYLELKDHAVTGETFQLYLNDDYQRLETIPQPGKEEIGRYYESEDYISHTSSKRNWFEKLYHLVREFNLKRKLKLINSLGSPKKSLLDFGCGTGDFLNIAKRDGWEITGIEPNDQARSLAEEKNGNVIFHPEKWNPVMESYYDVITLWHVLEHLHEPSKEIKRLSDLLSENGSLVVALPNFRSFDASYYKSDWAAFDVPRHLWHFSRDAVNKLASENGLRVDAVYPMKFDAYYVSLLSEKYRSGWMNIFSAFFVASRSNLRASRTGEYSSLIYVLKKP